MEDLLTTVNNYRVNDKCDLKEEKGMKHTVCT